MTDNQRGLIEDSIQQIDSRAGIVWSAEFLEDYAAALRALLAENAALKAKPDPLAEMWRELEAYQPQADADGHGKSWAKMCEERTEAPSRDAARDAARASAALAPRRSTWLARQSALDASRHAAWMAARAAARYAEAMHEAARCTDAIRRAKKVKP